MANSQQGKKQRQQQRPLFSEKEKQSQQRQEEMEKTERARETKSLPKEFASESLDLGFVPLHIFYVDLGDEPYWTWRLCSHVGGRYGTKNDAKWAAVENAYELLSSATETLEPAYKKAVDRHGLEP